MQLSRTHFNASMLAATYSLGLLGCSSRPQHLAVEVRYVPTSEVDVDEKTWTGTDARVFIAPVADNRSDPGVIGKNEEEAPPIPIRAEPPDAVPQMIAAAVAAELEKTGVKVVESQEQSNRRVVIRLQRLWVDEESTYRGSLEMVVCVSDSQGLELAKIPVSGSSTRFGRSLSADNYRETVSDALADAIEDLLENKAFVKALKPSSS